MHRSLLAPSFVLASFLSISDVASAQCPDWSGQFGAPTIRIEQLAVRKTLAGDDIYARGELPASQGTPATSLANWNGSEWLPMVVPDNGGARTIAAFDDGTGSALYVSVGSNIHRWDGSAWTQVGSGFDGDPGILEVVEEPGGPSLYFLDRAFPIGQVSRWNGATWDSIGGGIAALGAGSVVALASYTTTGGTHLYGACRTTNSVSLIRWTGATWEVVPAPTNIDDLEVFDDGAGPCLFASGAITSFFQGVNYRSIARWNGTDWANLGGLQASQGAAARKMRVHDDGSGPALYVAGSFDIVGGTTWSSPCIARRRAGVWSTVGHGFARELQLPEVRDLAIVDVGAGPRLAAVGRFDTSDGWYRPSGPMTWDGAGWSPLERRDDVGGWVEEIVELDLAPFGRSLWVGTSAFGVAGAPETSGIARWDGTNWHGVGHGFNGQVRAITTSSVGGATSVYAGGTFQRSGDATATSLARWSGTEWLEVGGGVRNGPLSPGDVHALVEHDDGSGEGTCLFVAGRFDRVGTSTYASNIARWNGTYWTSLNGTSGFTMYALAVFDDGNGPQLYAAGSFTELGSTIGVARWNGTSWTGLGSGLGDGSARALIVFDDGSGPALYVGGDFVSAGGILSPRVMRWRNGAWSSVGGGIGTFSSGGVIHAFAAHVDPSEPRPVLLAVGQFDAPAPLSTSRIARWNGTAWSAFTTELPDREVFAVSDYVETSSNEPALYIGGRFDFVGTTHSPNFAKHSDPCDVDAGVAFCLGDGLGTPCPCGNDGAPATVGGCLNASGGAGAILASGRPSLSADTLVLRATGLQNRPLLFFQGTAKTNGGAGSAFGDGLRCAGGTVRRIAIRLSSTGDSVYPEGTEPPVSVAGSVTTPGSRFYQAWYRDPAPGFCTPATFNATNGVEIVWTSGP